MQAESRISRRRRVLLVVSAFNPAIIADMQRARMLALGEQMIAEGADILDIGGESTRPGSARVLAEQEISRVVPLIIEITKRFDIPVSIDTSKAEVAKEAVEAGAEIINDISGLRFDESLAGVAGKTQAGLVLMHMRGTFETMHDQEPVADIIQEVKNGLKWSIDKAREFGTHDGQIALDVGLGFSKTFGQNLELMAKLDDIRQTFPAFALLAGSSRKSFIGKILGGKPVGERLPGSLASAAISVWNGANIIRAHDVRETVDTLRVVEAIREQN